jgi:hypothetical protein
VVECTGLENRNTRKRIVGSNPTLSAMMCSVNWAFGNLLSWFVATLPERAVRGRVNCVEIRTPKNANLMRLNGSNPNT